MESLRHLNSKPTCLHQSGLAKGLRDGHQAKALAAAEKVLTLGTDHHGTARRHVRVVVPAVARLARACTGEDRLHAVLRSRSRVRRPVMRVVTLAPVVLICVPTGPACVHSAHRASSWLECLRHGRIVDRILANVPKGAALAVTAAIASIPIAGRKNVEFMRIPLQQCPADIDCAFSLQRG